MLRKKRRKNIWGRNEINEGTQTLFQLQGSTLSTQILLIEGRARTPVWSSVTNIARKVILVKTIPNSKKIQKT